MILAANVLLDFLTRSNFMSFNKCMLIVRNKSGTKGRYQLLPETPRLVLQN